MTEKASCADGRWQLPALDKMRSEAQKPPPRRMEMICCVEYPDGISTKKLAKFCLQMPTAHVRLVNKMLLL